jgi:hypothetical protein
MKIVSWKKCIAVVTGLVCLIAINGCVAKNEAVQQAKPGPGWIRINMKIDDATGDIIELKYQKPGSGPPQDMPDWNGADPPESALRSKLYFTHASPGCVYVNHGGRWYRICT